MRDWKWRYQGIKFWPQTYQDCYISQIVYKRYSPHHSIVIMQSHRPSPQWNSDICSSVSDLTVALNSSGFNPLFNISWTHYDRRCFNPHLPLSDRMVEVDNSSNCTMCTSVHVPENVSISCWIFSDPFVAVDSTFLEFTGPGRATHRSIVSQTILVPMQ